MKKLSSFKCIISTNQFSGKGNTIYKTSYSLLQKMFMPLLAASFLTILCMSISADYDADKVYKNTYEAPHTVQMGFSFSGLWDAITNWFSKEDEDVLNSSTNAGSTALLAPDCPPANVATPYIGGQIFRDVEHNGLLDAIDLPVEGVLISVYSDVALVGTTMSSPDGDYLFQSASMTVGTEYRVEFTGYPDYFKTATSASGSNTSVQFVTPNICNVDFGLIDPYEYTGENPFIVVPCYVPGDNIGDTLDALVSINYDSLGPILHEAQAQAIGTTYGLAYSKQSEVLYAGAFQKRFTGYAQGTPGSIYVIDNPTDGNYSGALFVDLNTLFGTDVVGSDPHDFTLTDSTDAPVPIGEMRDSASFNMVGRTAFGDIDITYDGDTLWAVNLFDRSLYGLPLGDPRNPTAPTSASQVHVVPMIGNLPGIPAGVSDNEIIPFGLKYYRGDLYVGVVTNGETNGLSTMFGLAYRYSSSTGVFTKVVEFPLNYARGCGFGRHGDCYGPADWVSWTVDNSIRCPTGMPNKDGTFGWDQGDPQPIFSDIEFDAAGNMIIGLRDRYGDQTAQQTLSPDLAPICNPDGIPSTSGNAAYGFVYHDAYGDILRATPLSSAWTVNIADFTDMTSDSAAVAPFDTFDGPSSEPFFGGDNYNGGNGGSSYGHEEVVSGALSMDMITNTVVATTVDPIADFSQGLRLFDTQTGELTEVMEIIPRNLDWSGKGGALGDLEFISSSPPIEIGNRLWTDIDIDGIQDPGESGINGVPVELYLETSPGVFTKVAETTTGTSGTQGNGAYLFSNDGAAGQTWLPGYTEVAPFSNYEVRLSLTDVQTIETDITAFTSSNQNSDISNDANTDLNDSDLVDNNGTAIISYTTGDNGFHNHTLDFGVINCVIPATPAIAITDNDCTASTPGAFTVTTACEVGSTLEWSTDNGTTWSTTIPTYDTTNAQTVIARCVDADGCLSVESATLTSAPTDCCATPPCFNITIQQN